MKLKNDFFLKLIPYLIIGVYGVLIDLSVSNFIFNLPVFPDAIHKNLDSALTFHSINPTFTIAGFAITAAIIGGIAGLVNNFLMNEVLVYTSQGTLKQIGQRFLKYSFAILVGGIIVGKVIVLNICLSVFGMGFSTSNLIAIAVGTLINYPINYFWTWRKEK